MFFGEIAEVPYAVVPAFAVEVVGHVRRVPAPRADQQEGIGGADLFRQGAICVQERQDVFPRLDGAHHEKVARR